MKSAGYFSCMYFNGDAAHVAVFKYLWRGKINCEFVMFWELRSALAESTVVLFGWSQMGSGFNLCTVM